MKQATTLIQELKNGTYNNSLTDIYQATNDALTAQIDRYVKAIESYITLYGDEEVAIYSAPGRSEIGGNHTDHQHGAVLAAAINLDAIAVVGNNIENKIELTSEGYKPITIDMNDINTIGPKGTTLALIKGVAKGLIEHNFKVGPFKAYVTSDVLNGAGMSSSAAFETVIGTIFSGMFNDRKVTPVDIAIIGQYAENVYFGKPCGLMDQMACSVGSLVAIDFKNPSMPIVEKITFDLGANNYSLCIIDTKGSHADLTDDYAAIPADMKSVAKQFGKEVLREIPVDKFYKNIPKIREKCGDRAVLRAIHFFGENQRAIDEAAALKAGDFDAFKNIFVQSAKSSFQYLQNIYSSKDLNNQAVSIALAVSENILGDNGVCRVHGGGFAGTIQAFVKTDFVNEYKTRIEAVMGEGTCHILQVRPFGGIQIL